LVGGRRKKAKQKKKMGELPVHKSKNRKRVSSKERPDALA